MKACLLSLLIYSNPSAKEHSKQIIMKNPQSLTRRSFLYHGHASLVVPALLSAKKSQSGPLVIGEGEHRYEVHHDWAKLPDKYTWQTTHNAAVDKTGNSTSFTKAVATKPITHPFSSSIPMANSSVPSANNSREADTDWRYGEKETRNSSMSALTKTKSFRQAHPQGGNGLGKICSYGQRSLPKGRGWTRSGQIPRERPSTLGSGCISAHQFAFLDDGGFLLADGYGSFCIHRYDKDANWVSKFGGPGKGEGKFATPHGIWIDRREGKNNASPFATAPTTPCSSWKWTGNTSKP